MLAVACDTFLMKVLKPEVSPKARPPGRDVYSIRIDNDLMFKLDRLARQNDTSRNRLIEEILKQAISDPKFVVRLS